eukprot:CAMPEP_0195250072 /NCGR_PEP_ID=MMETSP0706-20130129/2489_1 /TAXON_ID=33640 /ORGANISM="Asterionellopsis glacialis, Strain CCMP134" /LENGTH=254 /DNA_ID=CAMNT_0040301987 /DNA_START=17 /DNA_END=781 /DNA_ORIENTATION=-
MDVKDGELVLKASGWEHLYIPEPSVSNYAITGHESQVVSMALQPGESLQGEPGTMMYLSHGIQQGVSCEGFLGRCCSGEACYVVNYTNESDDSNKAYVALTPNYPTAKVVPVDLSSPNVNGTLIAQQGAYMASYGNVEIDISLDCNFCRCCCSGLGLVRQKLSGDGTAFLAATGTIVQKVLGEGETILVDTNCVLAFAESCKLDLRRAGGILGMIGGGEGIFNTTLTGPGLVIVQSMNETMFQEALVADKMYRR